MKIAFTTKGREWQSEMEPRFGRTDYILIYDEDKDTLIIFDNCEAKSHEHGAGPTVAKILIENGVNVLITGNGPGGNAIEVLKKSSIEVYSGAIEMSVKEAYDKYKNKKLPRF
ncbi:MAG: NifB/NifX family molybdenum-iron cluster-binding protein [Sulfurospirillaceae bacterium]|nr:NifB/NifX family molybdenum-iron cluster-binding protein [Sulfurospirillaceae bacterium]